MRVIDNLPIDDAGELQTAVYDRVDENRISYSIKNIKCSECQHEEKRHSYLDRRHTFYSNLRESPIITETDTKERIKLNIEVIS